MFVLNELSENYDFLKEVEYSLKEQLKKLSFDVDYLVTTRYILKFNQETVIMSLTGVAYFKKYVESMDCFTIYNDKGNMFDIYYYREVNSDCNLIYIRLDEKILNELFVKRLRLYLLLMKDKKENSFFKKVFKKSNNDYKNEFEEEYKSLLNQYKKIQQVVYHILYVFNQKTTEHMSNINFKFYDNFGYTNISNFILEGISDDKKDISLKESIINQFDIYFDLDKGENSLIDAFLLNTKEFSDISFHLFKEINEMFSYNLSDKDKDKDKDKESDDVVRKIYSSKNDQSLKDYNLITNEKHSLNYSTFSMRNTSYNHSKTLSFILGKHKTSLELNDYKMDIENGLFLSDLFKNENNELEILELSNFNKESIFIEEEEYGDLLLDFYKAIKETNKFSSISNFFFNCNENSIFYQLNYLEYLDFFKKCFSVNSYIQNSNVKFLNKNLISIQIITYEQKFDLIHINFKEKKIELKDFALFSNITNINGYYRDSTGILSLLKILQIFFSDFEIVKPETVQMFDMVTYKDITKNSFSILIQK